MPRFQSKIARPLPMLWYFTDERVEDARMMAAIARLPRGAGIIFRHYRLDAAARHALFRAVRQQARRRGLVLLLAGTPALARRWGADGWHGRARATGPLARPLLHSMAAHDQRELNAARAAGADCVFLSPAFPTRSHPGAPALGRVRFALLARQAAMPVMALGGITRQRAQNLTQWGAAGWGAIDGLSR